jgi:2-succinyl-5-enolpyruvyl-6-hydroxy-3-cyclohexene-1-carboxylate synthase
MKTNSIHYGRYWVLYDSNALWNNYIPKNFKIILINNGGGGIFRIRRVIKKPVLIPSLKLPLFNSGTFSKMYGFDYTIASDEQSLSKGLATLYAQNEKPGLLEVFTNLRE